MPCAQRGTTTLQGVERAPVRDEVARWFAAARVAEVHRFGEATCDARTTVAPAKGA